MKEMDFARANGFARAIPSISSWKKKKKKQTTNRNKGRQTCGGMEEEELT